MHNLKQIQQIKPTNKQTDVAFLERDIKNRKHTFGIQLYDILQQQSSSQSTSASDTIFSASDEIQKAYEECKLDVETLEKKIVKKRMEMSAIGDGQQNSEGGGGGGSNDREGGDDDDGESASERNAELESGILPGY